MYKNYNEDIIENDIEVFRITPIIDKYYETAENTRIVGIWPNQKYYTTNIPRYVGRFIRQFSCGWGDGAQYTNIFYNDDTNKEELIPLSYSGSTCFKEVECKKLLKIKKMLKFMTYTIDTNSNINIDDINNIGKIIMSNI